MHHSGADEGSSYRATHHSAHSRLPHTFNERSTTDIHLYGQPRTDADHINSGVMKGSRQQRYRTDSSVKDETDLVWGRLVEAHLHFERRHDARRGVSDKQEKSGQLRPLVEVADESERNRLGPTYRALVNDIARPHVKGRGTVSYTSPTDPIDLTTNDLQPGSTEDQELDTLGTDASHRAQHVASKENLVTASHGHIAPSAEHKAMAKLNGEQSRREHPLTSGSTPQAQPPTHWSILEPRVANAPPAHGLSPPKAVRDPMHIEDFPQPTATAPSLVVKGRGSVKYTTMASPRNSLLLSPHADPFKPATTERALDGIGISSDVPTSQPVRDAIATLATPPSFSTRHATPPTSHHAYQPDPLATTFAPTTPVTVAALPAASPSDSTPSLDPLAASFKPTISSSDSKLGPEANVFHVSEESVANEGLESSSWTSLIMHESPTQPCKSEHIKTGRITYSGPELVAIAQQRAKPQTQASKGINFRQPAPSSVSLLDDGPVVGCATKLADWPVLGLRSPEAEGSSTVLATGQETNMGILQSDVPQAGSRRRLRPSQGWGYDIKIGSSVREDIAGLERVSTTGERHFYERKGITAAIVSGSTDDGPRQPIRQNSEDDFIIEDHTCGSSNSPSPAHSVRAEIEIDFKPGDQHSPAADYGSGSEEGEVREVTREDSGGYFDVEDHTRNSDLSSSASPVRPDGEFHQNDVFQPKLDVHYESDPEEGEIRGVGGAPEVVGDANVDNDQAIGEIADGTSLEVDEDETTMKKHEYRLSANIIQYATDWGKLGDLAYDQALEALKSPERQAIEEQSWQWCPEKVDASSNAARNSATPEVDPPQDKTRLQTLVNQASFPTVPQTPDAVNIDPDLSSIARSDSSHSAQLTQHIGIAASQPGAPGAKADREDILDHSVASNDSFEMSQHGEDWGTLFDISFDEARANPMLEHIPIEQHATASDGRTSIADVWRAMARAYEVDPTSFSSTVLVDKGSMASHDDVVGMSDGKSIASSDDSLLTRVLRSRKVLTDGTTEQEDSMHESNHRNCSLDHTGCRLNLRL